MHEPLSVSKHIEPLLNENDYVGPVWENIVQVFFRDSLRQDCIVLHIDLGTREYVPIVNTIHSSKQSFIEWLSVCSRVNNFLKEINLQESK